jgi:hypothetical protein
MTLDLNSPVGRRVVAAGGRIESGQIANMRTLLLPAEPKTHTRLLGESSTLCGRPLSNHGHFAWQFQHRGDVAAGQLPAGSDPADRDACRRCSASPVIRATAEIAATRRSVLKGGKAA